MTYLFSIPLLLLLNLILSGGPAAADLISDTCSACAKGDKNINVGFCTSSLQASGKVSTLNALGANALKIVGNNVGSTKGVVQQLVKNPKNPALKGPLSDCLDLYSDATSTVTEAIKAYGSKRFSDANVKITSVMDAATTCEDGFKERKGLVSPLTKRNNDVFELGAISLCIMNKVSGSG